MMPFQIKLCGIDEAKLIEFHVRKRVDKLSSLCKNLKKCNVAVSIQNINSDSGRIFTVRIKVNNITKKMVNVKKNDTNVYAAIYAAFDAVGHLVNKYLHKQETYKLIE